MSESSDRDPARVRITPAMVEAGIAVLDDLEGEVSKAFLVAEVFLAMALVQDQAVPEAISGIAEQETSSPRPR